MMMRTTLTLDDDVARRVKAEAGRSGKSFKQTINELLRSALNPRRGPASRAPFRVEPRALGVRPGLNYDNVGEVLEQLEGLTHR
jgi:plasmid stability protein